MVEPAYMQVGIDSIISNFQVKRLVFHNNMLNSQGKNNCSVNTEESTTHITDIFYTLMITQENCFINYRRLKNYFLSSFI